MVHSLKESALQYAKADLRVFPLAPNSKGKQVLKSWKNEATTDLATIKQWWNTNPNYNIGIATGNGILVIDVDIKHDAKGLESLKKYGENLPTTAKVKTPSGGYHLYYYIKGDFKNRVNIYPGIDIRTDNGYVVAPPSKVDGQAYEWINDDPIAEADSFVYDFLDRPIEKENNRSLHMENEIVQGSRNDTLFKLACSLQSKGLDDKAILSALWQENKTKCTPPLTENEVKGICESAIKYIKGTSPYNKKVERPPTLKPISASTLETMDIPPIEWIVKGLLPIGTSLLGAPPKYFKSFMALGLGVNVALGNQFLGHDTVQSDVLYFDLESTPRRPKDRLEKIMGSFFPENFYVVTGDQDVKNINDGFCNQLVELLDKNPKIRLVIIDVYQKIRPPQKNNKNSYDRDYDDLNTLKKLADERSIGLLLIHHTKKGKENDVFDQLSGSTGLTGAMDAVWVITKTDRFYDEGVLNITGRDLESKRLKINFNKDTFQWEYMGDYDILEQQHLKFVYEQSPITVAIKQLLKQKSGSFEMSAKEIIDFSHFTDWPIEDTPQKVGLFIKANKQLLKNDGIEYEYDTTQRGKRLYKFNC